MTSSAHEILVISFGLAQTRAVYLKSGQIYSTAVATTRDDLAIGLATVTKDITKMASAKTDPTNVLICGSSAMINELRDQVKATFIGEDKAIAAAERYLTKSTGTPSAVLDLGASAFLDFFPADKVARWLSFPTNLTDIENYLANKRLFPSSLPITREEYEIDLGLARQAIIKLGEKNDRDYLAVASNMNLVLTGGIISKIASLTDLTSLIVDSFFFSSGVKILVDTTNLLIPLGAVLSEHPDLEIHYQDGLRQIGSAIHLGGGPQSLTLEMNDRRKLQLDDGEIVTVPVSSDKTIKISISDHHTRNSQQLNGGEVGIIFDNRSKPLPVTASSKESINRIINWRKSLSSDSLVGDEKL